MSSYRSARWVVLGSMAVLIVMWWPLALFPVRVSVGDLAVTALFAVVSALTIPVVPALLRRALRPLPGDVGEPEARRLSHGAFVPAVGLGTIAATCTAPWAFLIGVMTGNPATYLVPFLVSEMLLYRHVLPRPETVESARSRLEADGATSYLWEVLTGRPGPLPLPD